MYVYKHNNVYMSIDMVIENSELKSAELYYFRLETAFCWFNKPGQQYRR